MVKDDKSHPVCKTIDFLKHESNNSWKLFNHQQWSFFLWIKVILVYESHSIWYRNQCLITITKWSKLTDGRKGCSQFWLSCRFVFRWHFNYLKHLVRTDWSNSSSPSHLVLTSKWQNSLYKTNSQSVKCLSNSDYKQYFCCDKWNKSRDEDDIFWK